MCKEGWLVRSRQEGCMRVAGTVWNNLKGGATEKRGGETRIFKRGEAGSRGGCLKKGGWNPLTNYDISWLSWLYWEMHYIDQYWYFQRVTTKLYHLFHSSYQSIQAFSESYYQTMVNTLFKFYNKQHWHFQSYYKIILHTFLRVHFKQ